MLSGSFFLMGGAGLLAQDSQSLIKAAVQENADRFAKAFNEENAEAVAAFWTEKGTWSDPAGDLRIEGRKSLKESYRSLFDENPGSVTQTWLLARLDPPEE